MNLNFKTVLVSGVFLFSLSTFAQVTSTCPYLNSSGSTNFQQMDPEALNSVMNILSGFGFGSSSSSASGSLSIENIMAQINSLTEKLNDQMGVMQEAQQDYEAQYSECAAASSVSRAQYSDLRAKYKTYRSAKQKVDRTKQKLNTLKRASRVK